MKILIIVLLYVYLANATEVDLDIQADSFLSNQSKNIIEFKGNVVMVKGKDTIKANEVIVYTKISKDTNKTIAKKYKAIGDVKFTIKQDTSFLKGHGEIVIYNIDDELYEIIGNGYLEDTVSQRILTGEKIYVNNKLNTIKIDGKKDKPVTFQLKMISGK
jgi:lipopolysaccharide export system protein LptA